MEELIEFDPTIKAALNGVPNKKKRKFLGYLLLLGVQISAHLFEDSADSYQSIKRFTKKLRNKKDNSSVIQENLMLLQKEISNLNHKIEEKFCQTPATQVKASYLPTENKNLNEPNQYLFNNAQIPMKKADYSYNTSARKMKPEKENAPPIENHSKRAKSLEKKKEITQKITQCPIPTQQFKPTKLQQPKIHHNNSTQIMKAFEDMSKLIDDGLQNKKTQEIINLKEKAKRVTAPVQNEKKKIPKYLKNVESKIKDEVAYHRQVGKKLNQLKDDYESGQYISQSSKKAKNRHPIHPPEQNPKKPRYESSNIKKNIKKDYEEVNPENIFKANYNSDSHDIQSKDDYEGGSFEDKNDKFGKSFKDSSYNLNDSGRNERVGGGIRSNANIPKDIDVLREKYLRQPNSHKKELEYKNAYEVGRGSEHINERNRKYQY